MPQSNVPQPFSRRRFAGWLLLAAVAILASSFTSNRVWAQSVICSGNSSIPITPTLLNLVRTGPATYQISLCTAPTASVAVTVLPTPGDKLLIAPPVLTFTSTAPQTVTLNISPTVPVGEAFTVELRHSAASADPNYNWGTIGMPIVVASHNIGNIVGVVFDDRNGNLAPDPGEPLLQGVTVALSGGATTQTDSAGVYRFMELAPGGYIVTLATPAGFTSALSTARTVNVVVGVTSAVDYPLVAQGVIQGVVFDDRNGNNMQDAGEPGVAGATVARSGGPSTTTDAAGAYRFTSVAPGSYTVNLTVPASYVASGPVARTVNLAAGEGAQVNFALQQQGVIQGVVFDDLNGNGSQDADEPGVSGVAVTRSGAPGTTTDGAGAYRFTSVAPGSYTVNLSVPAGYVAGSATVQNVSLGSGGSAQVNFALLAQGVIQGVVFDDLNGNGSQDTGEAGVAGATILLSNALSTTTSSSGAYRFSAVAPGGYTVSLVAPAGYVASRLPVRAVNVGSGGSAQANFAVQVQGLIQGVVFDDLNGNLRQDAGEPGIGGVTITRSDGPSTTTDAAGAYRFTAVAPGSYTVVMSVPAGYVAGPTDWFVNLEPGGAAQANFALQAQAVIQGVVFDDLNGNWMQDAGEPGIGGVLVVLDDGATARTATNGAYRFAAVVPGLHYLNVSAPVGYVATGLTYDSVNVGSGGLAQANFTLQAQGVVQGVVFDDLNGDGVQDAGEPGLGGVEVLLSGSLLRSAISAVNGAYQFSAVDPGFYHLTIPFLSERYVPSTDTMRFFSLTSSGAFVASFGLQELGVVQGVVFDDGNGNGIQEQLGEPGLGGVMVTLTNLRTTAQTTVMTDQGGGYQFRDVGPDDYRVGIDLPAGFSSLVATEALVEVNSGASGLANFPLQAPDAILGAVFVDINNNGLRDADEAGVAAVTITLTSAGAPQATTTDAGGEYIFSGLPSGSYTVTIGSLDGTAYTLYSAASVNVLLPATGNNSAAVLFIVLPSSAVVGTAAPGSTVELAAGAAERAAQRVAETGSRGIFLFLDVAPGSYNVTITPPPGFTAVTPVIAVAVPDGGVARADFEVFVNGAIQGMVFEDLDGNGLYDNTEQPLGGLTVRLLAGNTLVTETVTAGNGSYGFADLSAGTYSVAVRSDNFVQPQPVTATLSAAQPGANRNLPLARRFSISGRTYLSEGAAPFDAATTGIANVSVTITGPQGTTLLSNVRGFFRLDGLPAGVYTVTVTTPAGFTPATPATRTVTLAAASAGNGANFGLALPPPIRKLMLPIIHSNPPASVQRAPAAP